MKCVQLPALRLTGWRRTAAWGFLAAGSLAVSLPIALAFSHWRLQDWDLMTAAGQRVVLGLSPFDPTPGPGGGTWRYSPLLAYGFAFAAPIGRVGWALAPFALLLLLRDWRLIAIFLMAVPFWRDVENGLSFIEIPLVALIALRGSYLGGLALVALAVLMPRPMMIPLVGWQLWKDRRLRLPSLVVTVVLTAGAVLTGWGTEWIRELLRVTVSAQAGQFSIIGLIGPLWATMPVVAIWLTWRGHLGFAALAISPYWTPAYPLVLILEIPGLWPKPAGRTDRDRHPSDDIGPRSEDAAHQGA